MVNALTPPYTLAAERTLLYIASYDRVVLELLRTVGSTANSTQFNYSMR